MGSEMCIRDSRKDRAYAAARTPIAAGYILAESVDIVGRLRVTVCALSDIGGVEARRRRHRDHVAAADRRHMRIIGRAADSRYEYRTPGGARLIVRRWAGGTTLITGTCHERDALRVPLGENLVQVLQDIREIGTPVIRRRILQLATAK